MFSTKQSQIDYSPLNLDNPSATLNKIDEKFFAVELIAVQQIINTCVNNGCDIRRFIASPDTEDITIKDENRVVSIKLPNGMEITHAAMSDCLAMLTFAWAQKTGEVIYYLPHGSENLVKITSFQELFPDTTANLYTSSTDVKTLFQELSTLYKIEQPTNTK